MILWMDKKVACRMPPYADHYVGVGGAVINQNNEILLIKENRSLDARRWKLPGGFMNPQERLADAVVREVKEETGVVAKFAGFLGVRETLNYKYNASDFYFCAVLTVDTTQGIAIEDTNEVKTA
jgi:8-oxo-dGTP diphosphatase